jgi:hypothetical protein
MSVLRPTATVRLKADTTYVSDVSYVVSGFSRTVTVRNDCKG